MLSISATTVAAGSGDDGHLGDHRLLVPGRGGARRSAQTPEEQLTDFVELSRAYHGPWDEVRDSFTDPQKLDHTGVEQHLLDSPWNRGRVVLTGDAVHACPPTIAQGAASDSSTLAPFTKEYRKTTEHIPSAESEGWKCLADDVQGRGRAECTDSLNRQAGADHGQLVVLV
jgi:hypothetical protein